MGSILHLDCRSGISGDMFVAAMLDLGADPGALDRTLNSLPLEGFGYKVSHVKRCGLDACDFDVIIDSGDRGHRRLPEILGIIDDMDATEGAKDLARRIFRILAESEAEVHGTTIDQVHFHELGAVDSIVDIVAAAVCLDSLGISETVVSEVFEGEGSVCCEHGQLPVPVPAVSRIVTDHGIPLQRMDEDGEHVTPTGAAIVAAIRTSDKLPRGFIFERRGVGAGKRYKDRPSVLRASIISEQCH